MAAKTYKYVFLGGGNAAGYFAKEYVNCGGPKNSLVIISDEPVISYERPTLSKAYLQPDGPRLPGFHTTVGGGGEKQQESWYKDNGIDYQLKERITKVDIGSKQLEAAQGNQYKYEKLVVGVGARAVNLADFKTPGSDLKNIFYLRDVTDADALNEAIQANKGKKAVVVGGGYIGLEVAAKLNQNGVEATLVFPEDHIMERLFTPDISNFYEKFYKEKGINIENKRMVKGFEGNGKVEKVVTDSGDPIPADLVVVGIGARPNQELFMDQLEIPPKPVGGLKTNGHLQTSNPDVYAVGDIAAFPQNEKFGGGISRSEHVANSRQSAAYVARELLKGNSDAYDYLPFFYSRIFNLSWQFYGSNKGEVVTFKGDGNKFGAYFLQDGKVVGGFIESGSPEENNAIKQTAIKQPKADKATLQKEGLNFATSQA